MITKGNKKKSSMGGSNKKKMMSVLKLSNKKLNKLAKQGKLKKAVGKKKLVSLLKSRVNKGPHGNQDHLFKEIEEQKNSEIPLQEADYEYFDKPDRTFNFLTDLSKERKTKKITIKRKERVIDDYHNFEGRYEKRSKLPKTENKIYKELLPIKSKSKGIIHRSIEVENSENEMEEVEEEKFSEDFKEEEVINEISAVEEFVDQKIAIKKAKQLISSFSHSILESVEENINNLTQLLDFINFTQPIPVIKLGMTKLMDVFKDIIPEYKIRMLSDTEKHQMMKKETRKILSYEEILVINYQKFINDLENIAKGHYHNVLKNNNKHKNQELNPVVVSPKTKKVLRWMSIDIIGQLLLAHPHFNYRTNLIGIIVRFMLHRESETSDLACKAVRMLFSQDRLGEVTLETIRLIGRAIKAKNYEVKPKVLETFLSLKIKEINFKEGLANGKSGKAQELRDQNAALSRRDRKKDKQMRNLERELQDVAAEENTKLQRKLHTEVISLLFLTYFRILKLCIRSTLLPSVLKGLAKFAHLINVSYFDDLFAVLTKLVESGDLTTSESLHCIQTALTLLMGQGSAFNIDPFKFYANLYKVILSDNSSFSTCNDYKSLLSCLDLMINKRRRQVSDQRAIAFAKRVSIASIHAVQSQVALSLLAALKDIFISYPKSDQLLDSETIGNGVYMPEVDNPDYCNAQNTSLFELHLLRSSYDPNVRIYSEYILHSLLRDGQFSLPHELSRKKPIDFLRIDTLNISNLEIKNKPVIKNSNYKKRRENFNNKSSKR